MTTQKLKNGLQNCSRCALLFSELLNNMAVENIANDNAQLQAAQRSGIVADYARNALDEKVKRNY